MGAAGKPPEMDTIWTPESCQGDSVSECETECLAGAVEEIPYFSLLNSSITQRTSNYTFSTASCIKTVSLLFLFFSQPVATCLHSQFARTNLNSPPLESLFTSQEIS